MALSVINPSVGNPGSPTGFERILTPTTGNWLVAVVGCKSLDGSNPQFTFGDWSRNLWTLVYTGAVAANTYNSAAQIIAQVWVCPAVHYAGWSQLGVYASPLYSSVFDVASQVLGIYEVAGMTNGFLTVDSVTVATVSSATTLSVTLPAPSGGADCLMLGGAVTDSASGTISVTSAGWTALTQDTAANPNATCAPAWRESTTSQTVSWSSTVSCNWAAVAVAIRVTGVGPSQPNSNWPGLEFQLGFGQNLSTPVPAVQWTTLPDRLMSFNTQRGLQYELGFVQSSPTDLTLRNDDGAFSPRAGGSGTAVATGTATTLVVSNSSGATMNVGDFFQLKTSGGALKELNVFQITAIVAATNTTVTFKRADGTAGGALASTATGDVYSACPIDIYLPYRILASWNNVRYPVAVGWVERWPVTWDDAHWGTVQAVGIDVIATLTAQDVSPLRGEILKRNPNSYWPLNDPAGATTAQNWGSVSTVLTDTSSSNGTGASGSSSFGVSTQNVPDTGSPWPPNTQGSATSIVGDTGTGWSSTGMTAAEQATMGNALVGSPGNDSTFPSVANGVTICGTYFVTTNQENINVAMTSGATMMVIRSSVGTGAAATLLKLAFGTGSSGFRLTVWDKTTHATTTTNLSPTNYGDTFLMWAVTFNQTSWAFFDSPFPGLGLGFITGTCNLPATFGLIDIGGEADSSSNGLFMSGMHAHIAIFPRRLTYDELSSIGSAMVKGYPLSNFGSNDAINRKLYYVNWMGARSLNYGTFTVGTDIIGTTPVAEKIANIADYGMGVLFNDATGQIQLRTHERAVTQSSRATVGDRPDLGEIPFLGDSSNLELDFDPTYLYNSVVVNNTGVIASYNIFANNAALIASNTTSQAKYGTRTLGKTISVSSQSQAQTIANNLLSKYALPKQRISAVTIDVLTSGSWAFALSVEVGDVITLNRRPIGAPQISLTCVVLNITHTVDPPSKWEMKLILAPQ